MSRVRNPNELIQLSAVDGLQFWTDGPLAGDLSPRQHPGAPPELAFERDTLLWVVRPEDVVAARETCDFARAQGMNGGKIKHTNLTGGTEAHCGGEMRMLSDSCVAINASSGRYKVKDEQEIETAAVAFRASGYQVWYMGWDTESDRPLTFEVWRELRWMP